ncbi:MAG: iron-containing alcohol dehydrogenase, partial [Thermodesulfobacteriota bacterium]
TGESNERTDEASIEAEPESAERKERRIVQRSIIHTLQATWRHPTEIRFGAGRIRELPAICWALHLTRPLLITDAKLARRPFIRRILGTCRREAIGIGCFDGIVTEPDGEVILAGTNCFLKGGYNGIIAVGGGSVLDAAKAVALAATVGPQAMWEYRSGGSALISPLHKAPPIIAVPTTAGTGSEVDANAVILDHASGSKISLYHPDLMPAIVVADPELTRGLIPYLTATTGMDALAHNLEAYCSPGFHPILDAIAVQGVGYIKNWIRPACTDGRKLEPRVYMMAASIMGAIAFEKGLGAMHGIAHAVGAIHKIPHGRVIAAVMPYVLRFNRRAIIKRIADLARSIDLPQHSFDGLLDWIVTLRNDLGMPISLSAVGVRESDIPDITRMALADANMATNPIPVNEEKLQKLLRKALSGRL